MTRSFFFQDLKGDARYEYVIDYDVSSVEALYYVFGQKLDIALKMFKMGVDTREIVKSLGLPIDENSVMAYGFLPAHTATTEQIVEGTQGHGPESMQAFSPRTGNPDSEGARLAPKQEQVGSDIYSARSL